MRTRRRLFLFVVTLFAVSTVAAKKSQTVLEWKTGVLWGPPDPCSDSWDLYKKSLLIVGDDLVYHVTRAPIGRKANVTEGSAVKYTMADGDFYLQDEDGRVFKLTLVKKEPDPKAQERAKSGKRPCQP